jgi:hypothetical protein
MIGREVAHYRVTSKLGRGGMDSVTLDPEFARALRPNDSSVLYNCACAYSAPTAG